MEGNMMSFLDKFSPGIPPEILDNQSYLELNKMVSLFKDFVSRHYILETYLDRDEQQADFSFCIRALERDFLVRAFKDLRFQYLAGDEVWGRVINFVNCWSAKNTLEHKHVNNIWFEMDFAEYEKDIPQPCLFFDASQVKNSRVSNEWLFETLKKLLDSNLVDSLRDEIKNVIRNLPPGTGLFQVGTMLARTEDRVRIFTHQLTREQITGYLKNIGWPGDSRKINNVFNFIDNYSDGNYIVDFDVTREGISEKSGINFGLKNNKNLSFFLEELAKHNLCNDLKKRGVLSWKGSSCRFLGQDYGQTALLKNISHFKVAYLPGEGIRIKAYLKVKGVYLKELFKNIAGKETALNF
ncbi:MAG: hypothetical protein K9L17_06630 [Clostridiales bacterium]|nr:hypothetical protein [Clostridiales bacterium]MCF8022348.1 hypothetical protein [Clostridiales bacterium]